MTRGGRIRFEKEYLFKEFYFCFGISCVGCFGTASWLESYTRNLFSFVFWVEYEKS